MLVCLFALSSDMMPSLCTCILSTLQGFPRMGLLPPSLPLGAVSMSGLSLTHRVRQSERRVHPCTSPSHPIPSPSIRLLCLHVCLRVCCTLRVRLLHFLDAVGKVARDSRRLRALIWPDPSRDIRKRTSFPTRTWTEKTLPVSKVSPQYNEGPKPIALRNECLLL